MNGFGPVTVAKLDVTSSPVPMVSDIPPPPRRARAWPALVVLGAALCVGGFVALTMHKSREQTAAPLPTAEAPHRVASRPKVPRVETVRVRISVDPPEAVVQLDGHELSGNPFTASLPRDNAEHELVASAKGCRSAKQSIHLNQSVDVLIALKRLWTYMPPRVNSRSAETSASASPSSACPSVAHPSAADPLAASTLTGGARP